MSSLFNLRTILPCLGFFCFFILSLNVARAQRQLEQLDRGVVAVNMGEGNVYVGWRLLGTDPENIAFNLFRQSGNEEAVKLNRKPITQSTNWIDSTAGLNLSNSYFVRTVGASRNPAEQRGAGEQKEAFILPANAPVRQYLSIPLQTPEGYSPNDASVGDLDGDGTYEIIVHMTGRARDNSQDGITDPPVFEAYRLDGTRLWRINLGRNIREGAHYTQFVVYDLDGDGKAEFACKTADGTTDGKGKVIGDPDADWVDENGFVLEGPEYFTVFSGETGAELATAAYIAPRGDLGGWGGVGGNGGNDSDGNRADRFLACVAYLDGELPSVIMCRGYYGRTVLAAWDWRNGKLSSRWVFDSENRANPYSGMGNHNLTVADVDGDGRDEIVYGSMCVDDDGTGLYTTGLRHGDALHVFDMDPAKPGMEVWGIHENEEPVPGYENGYGAAMFSAGTGEIYWGVYPGEDVGRGLAADIDPRYPGAEVWTNKGELFTCTGEKIGTAPGSANFAVWWDGDLLRELLDRNRISKWDWKNGADKPLLTAEECTSNNGSKANPALSADLLGDWREEVVWRTSDNKELRIYTTVIPTEYRFPTLMHDVQYRLSIAWQNVAYNQPPHLGFAFPKEKKEIIWQDDFENGPGNWVVETIEDEHSYVTVRGGKLLMDVSKGATIWFRKKLTGDIGIEFDREVIVDSGRNDRLSDFNMFWMATDPRNDNLFTRNGTFSQYHPLSLYYVGIGGNTNSTTRFRKYPGNGERTLLGEYTDAAHLLEAGREYHVKITVRDGITKVFVDGEEYFSYDDPEPLREGYFGFRTTWSRQEVDHFVVYSLD